MKAIFIACNQSYAESVIDVLDTMAVRGYTFWDEVQGRGSVDGNPHMGNHAWPTLNSSFLTMVPDEKVTRLLELLRTLDKSNPRQGLRAFVWNVEQSI